MSGAIAPAGWDCVVVGAGPAGLACAGELARGGQTVLLLEKNAQPGAKLLTTGGGRCNILCRETDPDVLARRFGQYPDRLDSAGGKIPQHPPQVRSLFRSWPPERLRDWLEAPGGPQIRLHQDEEGFFFPVAESARLVRDRLVAWVGSQGAALRLDTPVSAVQAGPAGYLVSAGPADCLAARQVVLACGGAAWPRTGSTGDVVRLAAPAGCGIQAWLPALSPLPVTGIRLEDRLVDPAASLAAWSGNVIQARIGLELEPGAPPVQVEPEEGTLLFTHEGLSGPAVLALSGRLAWLRRQGQVPALVLDLLPACSREALVALVDERLRQAPHAGLAGVFAGLLPQGLVRGLMELLGVDGSAPLSRLRKVDRDRVLGGFKALRLQAGAGQGLDKAIQSVGGVRAGDLDWPGLAFKTSPGLHAIGDAISLDRPTGGYSLTFCWASGLAAAQQILRTARQPG